MSVQTQPIVRIQTYVPSEWIPKILEYMKRKGYYSMSELVRDLIREKIIEGGK